MTSGTKIRTEIAKQLCNGLILPPIGYKRLVVVSETTWAWIRNVNGQMYQHNIKAGAWMGFAPGHLRRDSMSDN